MPNAAHLHLILVHGIPSLIWVSLLIYAFSLWFKQENGLRLATLVLVLISAVGLILAANTGETAADLLEPLPGISHDTIHEHEEFGELLFPFGLVTGLVVLIWYSRARNHPERVRSWAGWIGILLVATTAVMTTITSNLGGHIRHPEVVPGWKSEGAVIDQQVAPSELEQDSGEDEHGSEGHEH